MSLNKYREKSRQRGDLWIIFLVILLSLIGLAMISSASVVVSYDRYSYNTYYLTKQAVSFGLGAMLMIFCTAIDYKYWSKISVSLLVIGIALLAIVIMPGFGQKIAGAQRWIEIGPFTLQPSEVIKLIYIIYAATWLSSKKEQIRNLFSGLLPFAIVLGIIGFLIISQPDLSTLLVIIATAASMVIVAGATFSHLALAGSLLVVMVISLIQGAGYRLQRILTFFNPSVDPLGAGYQINQALITIGSGGWWGLGFGQSRQKYLYLPQPYIDTIFAVIVEELGFIRASLIIVLLLILIYKIFTIALNSKEPFGRLLASGVGFWIAFQTFVNIGAVTGLLPLTGIPLPFISYGGSSLIMLMASVGIVYNVSKYGE